MMEWASKDLVGLVYHLLPGFLAAWVFYSLSSHPKETPFERVVGALIFTVIAQTLTSFVRRLLVFLGGFHVLGRKLALGAWAEDTSLAWSLLISFFVGLLFARFSNNDKFHRFLRRHGWTKRTSFPSEWFSVLNREQRWIILHMTGGRRLYGWPEEWPDQPASGHFILKWAEWLLDDGRRAPLHLVEKIVVAAGDVEMIEFLKSPDEVTVDEATLDATDRLLTHPGASEEGDHVEQGPAADPAPAEG